MIELSNTEYNKYLWDKYAGDWDKFEFEIESTDIDLKEKKDFLEYIGDEWGDKKSVIQVVNEFILPYISVGSKCAEIGSGGGRITSKVAPRVASITCFDISDKMLQSVKEKLKDYNNIEYVLTDGRGFPKEITETFDFIYSFDVFVHLDLHSIWAYFLEIKRMLKEDGKVFLHTSNLEAPQGWNRFVNQKEYSVEGHYFITPSVIDVFAERANFDILKTSSIDPSNFYYNRDFLFVLGNKKTIQGEL